MVADISWPDDAVNDICVIVFCVIQDSELTAARNDIFGISKKKKIIVIDSDNKRKFLTHC